MNATKNIMDILSACGCKPEQVAPDHVKINAPEAPRKSCETCARRETCTKPAGHMFGYCSTDWRAE